MTKQLEILRERAAEAQRAVAAEIERIQNDCTHALSVLTFDYSGVSSYKPGRVEHGVTVSCRCGKTWSKHISIED